MVSSSWRSGSWPWPTTMRASGTSEVSSRFTSLDALHAVVQEEDLAAPEQLAPDSLLDELRGCVA